MGTEELKVVLEMINGVKDGAVSITIVYLLLTSLVPLLKYSIVGYVVLAIVTKISKIGKEL
ncbi:hypothetical protein KAR91_24680 [Candidatus Pacearchaeota archaeon]|nr:hypothetical protein [Candidatus Pacearchaeota archaeon]